MNPTSLPLHIQFTQMASGNWLSQSIYAAAKLGVADYLCDRPHHCDELAQLINCHASSLYRLLRALAGVGIFTETEPQTFALTPLAEFLRSDIPQSMRSMCIMLGDQEHYQAWGNILHSIRTGEPAFDHYFGQGVFPYFAQHPESAEVFEQAMNNFSANELHAIISAYDFSSYKTLVDVGGGYGELLGSILQKNPQSSGILFDEDYVIQKAEATLHKHGIYDRCRRVSGSFFESIPTGGDAYLLKHIVHDWDDERSIAILKNCRQAIGEGAKVLILEMVVPTGNSPSAAKMLDMNMLVMCPGGKERTADEFEAILTQAGLKLLNIIPTQEDIHIIEAGL